MRRVAAKRAGICLQLAFALLVSIFGGCFDGDPTRPTERSEILVVINGDSGLSRAIGHYYVEERGIPKRNVVTLQVPPEQPGSGANAYERISRARFEALIRKPLEEAIHDRELVDQIQVIVTTKGLPLGIDGEGSMMETWLRDVRKASVDAELSLLYSDAIGSAGVVQTVNPFFGSDLSFREFRRRNPDSPLRYMVARLTGYQTDVDVNDGLPRDVRALVDRAHDEPGGDPVVGSPEEPAGDAASPDPLPEAPPAPDTLWLIDQDPERQGGFGAGNTHLLEPTVAALTALGLRVESDRTTTFVSDAEALQGYASWGSNDRNDPGPPYYGRIGDRLFPGSFARRAIALDFVSSNARTFSHAPRYGQSLIADLLRLGASGAAGHVFEPALSGVPRPYLVLTAFAEGRPAVEAFYRSIPYLGWMNVYIGDPMLTVPHAVARGDDRDGDGVADGVDNCLFIPNADQRDSNADGFGNLCDADVDGDGVVTTSWGVTFPMSRRGDVEWIGLAAQNGPYDPDFDLDGDGTIDSKDVSIAQLCVFLLPGPKGRRPGKRF